MKCRNCNGDLFVSDSKMIEDNTICKQKLVCTNQNCELYCGHDTNNPRIVAETRRIEV